jgi:hypothetical protein
MAMTPHELVLYNGRRNWPNKPHTREAELEARIAGLNKRMKETAVWHHKALTQQLAIAEHELKQLRRYLLALEFECERRSRD